MGEAAAEGDEAGSTVTAIVVRYLDGRRIFIDDDSDDIVIVDVDDTTHHAAKWLFAERSFEKCRRHDAVAEVCVVSVQSPSDPAELPGILQAAAATCRLSYGFVRVAELYSEVG